MPNQIFRPTPNGAEHARARDPTPADEPSVQWILPASVRIKIFHTAAEFVQAQRWETEYGEFVASATSEEDFAIRVKCVETQLDELYRARRKAELLTTTKTIAGSLLLYAAPAIIDVLTK